MLRRKYAPFFLMAFSATLLLAACDNDATGPTPPASMDGPALPSFDVGTVTLQIGEAMDLSSLLTPDWRMPVDEPSTAQWTSSDESVVTVSQGTVEAQARGVALVTFESQGQRVSIVVEVL